MKYFILAFLFHSFMAFPQASPDLIQTVEMLKTPIGLIAVSNESNEEVAKFISESAVKTDNYVPRECAEEPAGPNKSLKKKRPHLVSSEKLRPSVEFYFEVTAPVKEIESSELDEVDIYPLLNDLKPVIQAENSSDRSAAIHRLCRDKDSMQKIKYSSALFNIAGYLYNTDLKGGGDDLEQNDDTRPEGETQMITIQRQYDAFNRLLYTGSGPEKAGVCRHAAILVMDFLESCGFENKNLSSLGYSMDNLGGHAIVEVKDPESGSLYTLNWGELSQSRGSLLSSRDIPSDQYASVGSFIQVYSYDSDREDGTLEGFRRTNRGVVAARLLGTDDGDYDMTAYQTYEGGAEILLSGKINKYSDGSQKTKKNTLKTELIHATRASRALAADSDTLTGASVAYVFEKDKVSKNGHSAITYGGPTLGALVGEEDLSYFGTGDRYSSKMAAIAGTIGHRRVFILGKSSQLGAFAQIQGEGSYGTLTKMSSNEDSEFIDGILYSRVGASAQTTIKGAATLRASHARNINVLPSLSWNTGADFQATSDRKTTEFSILVPSGGTTFSGTYRSLADVQRKGNVFEVGMDREKVSSQVGYEVYKNSIGDTEEYVIMRVDYRPTKKIDLSAGARVDPSFQAPMAQMSVRIRPFK